MMMMMIIMDKIHYSINVSAT